jgi:tRNA threonylcarbamoyladenosine biosynthesis protein TsaE
MHIEVGHAPIVKSLHWTDEAATQRFAAALAALPALRHAFIELHGELGAGKTTLVRHLLRALGVTGRVKSPTYAVVEPYTVAVSDTVSVPPDRPDAAGATGAVLSELSIWHFDFYRFSDPREWEDAGFRDIFASPGLKLAEWPDKAAGFVPRADLVIELETLADEARHVTLRAQTAIGALLLQAAEASPLATVARPETESDCPREYP